MIAAREDAKRKREEEQQNANDCDKDGIGGGARQREAHPLDAISERLELEKERRANPSMNPHSMAEFIILIPQSEMYPKASNGSWVFGMASRRSSSLNPSFKCSSSEDSPDSSSIPSLWALFSFLGPLQ